MTDDSIHIAGCPAASGQGTCSCFDALGDLSDIEPPTDVVDFTKVSRFELIRHLDSLSQELYTRHEMLQPTTAEGRRLHSERAAVLIALRTQHPTRS